MRLDICSHSASISRTWWKRIHAVYDAAAKREHALHDLCKMARSITWSETLLTRDWSLSLYIRANVVHSLNISVHALIPATTPPQSDGADGRAGMISLLLPPCRRIAQCPSQIARAFATFSCIDSPGSRPPSPSLESIAHKRQSCWHMPLLLRPR